ncbi:MAG: helix-turn-helix transcriptional regulator [Ginsengibacter sp.]
MPHNKIKEFRLKNNLTQDEMAEALHISQNAYSLIECGKTRLIDEERITIISQKLGVSAIELELFNGFGITQNFNDKAEYRYASYIETLNADNKELTNSILEQIKIKDQRIAQLLLENAQLLLALTEKS